MIIVSAIISAGAMYLWQASIQRQMQYKLNFYKDQQIEFVMKQEQSLRDQKTSLVTKNNNWYSHLLDKLNQLDHANTSDSKCMVTGNFGIPPAKPQEEDCITGKVSETDIGGLYYSGQENIAYVLISGMYGGSGFKLIKYDAKADTLEIAKREDFDGGNKTKWFAYMDKTATEKKPYYPWFNPPTAFSSYDQGVMTLRGITGDAGCEQTNYFRYDIAANYLSITKSCGSCEGQKEQCTEF
jgi:hypothetical protein